MHHLFLTLEIRLKVFIRSWPPFLAKEFTEYYICLQSKAQKYGVSQRKGFNYPYWLLLPIWLQSRYAKTDKRNDKRFLKDVLWVQYCLFLVLRIQDDLFDRHTHRLALIFAANLFLLEVKRGLEPYFDAGSCFWKTWDHSLQTSTRAIVEIATLQYSKQSAPQKLISEYRKVASIFNIGTVAYCLRYRRLKELPLLEKFIAEMAVAGQLMDDLQDMKQDLDDGKYNYAVKRILQRSGRSMVKPNKVRRALVHAILLTDGLELFFKEIGKHLVIARKPVAQLDLAEALSLVQSHLEGVEWIQNHLRRKCIDIFFKNN
ncbi:hypothetical protein GX408_01040 [bacterium]|nr:hypothetical protein [bacterium]